MIYHITPLADWQRALQDGQYTAASLNSEGFIHASTRDQVVGTANLFYNGQAGLVLLGIDPAKLAAELRYDTVTTHGGEQQFPHIYGPLNLDAVFEVMTFEPLPDGSFRFPGK